MALTFNGVFPIGDSDPKALPAKDIPSAVAYYVHVLGFTLVARDAETATLRRDDATIGLAKNGADPDQASIYFAVSDVDALHAELSARHLDPTPVRADEHGGDRYRVTFAREPYGVCFCFGQKA
jgi:lactoylglutathione lyase